MNTSTVSVAVEPVAAQAVTVQPMQIRILNLSIGQSAVVRYLKGIPAEKLEIALLHAIEVGIVAMQAPREGCRP
jgi:hypothetical protein